MIVIGVPPSTEPLLGATDEIAGVGAGEMLSERVVEIEVEFASLTCVVKEKTPAAVGIPAIVPLALFKFIPVGRWPLLTLQE
jgi:hypothetical protein